MLILCLLLLLTINHRRDLLVQNLVLLRNRKPRELLPSELDHMPSHALQNSISCNCRFLQGSIRCDISRMCHLYSYQQVLVCILNNREVLDRNKSFNFQRNDGEKLSKWDHIFVASQIFNESITVHECLCLIDLVVQGAQVPSERVCENHPLFEFWEIRNGNVLNFSHSPDDLMLSTWRICDLDLNEVIKQVDFCFHRDWLI